MEKSERVNELNNPQITIYFPTKYTFKEKEELGNHIGSTSGVDAAVIVLENGEGKSLTSIFKKALEDAKTDVVVFIHDDIEFLKRGWGREVLRIFEENKEYGILGVAGSAEFDEHGAWWNYKKKYGQVLHRKDGKSWLTEFSPILKSDVAEVCVIDGLFMAIKKSRISQTFDTSFEGFNMYDIDFCLSNFIDGKCKIGVTTNIRMAHNSVGELKPNWFENRDKINAKYGKYFPIKVK